MRGNKGGSWGLAEEGTRPEQEKLGPQGHHGTLLGLFRGKQVPMGELQEWLSSPGGRVPSGGCRG